MDKSYENTEFNEKISVSPCLEIPTEKETKEKIRIFNGLKYDIISIYELKDYLEKEQFNIIKNQIKNSRVRYMYDM